MTFPAQLRAILVLASLLLVALVVRPVRASEAEAPAATVDAFVAEVLQRNPGLRARLLTRDAARSEANAAGLFPDPELAVMLDQVPERPAGEMPMVRYQLSQMLPWPGKLGFMQAAAERRTDAAAADSDTRRLDVIRDAKRAYWMLLMNQGVRQVAVAGRGLLETVSSAALARYGAGSGAHHDVVRAQVQLSALEVEILNLEGERVATIAMLNALRDRPSDAEFGEAREPVLPPSSTLPSLDGLERLAIARRPELARMRAMRREEEAMAALARRERYPDVMTSVWYNQMMGEPDTGGVMLGIGLPIFNVRRQGRLADAADYRAASAESDSRAMQTMIRFEIADATRRWVTAAQTLEVLRSVASPRANQSFGSALAAYSTGAADMSAVLQAWQSLQAIERARVEAGNAGLNALADLERAVGGSLKEMSQ